MRPIGLSQTAIYADVLEGVPNREINDRIVAQALEVGQRLYWLAPALIPPIQHSLGGNPLKAALPPVRCIGRFRSLQPAHDPNAERSEACIVWFQAEFAFPIEPEIVQAIQTLKWAEIARDDFM